MMNKSKQLLIGFIIGVLVCSIIPVYSAVQEYILQLADYKLLVNGIEYNDAEYPILSYQGRTYIPLRKVADILGVQLNWNDKLGQAEIVKEIKNITQNINDPKQTELISYEKDGVMLVNIEGIEYIEIAEINKFCTDEHPFRLDYNEDNNGIGILIITSIDNTKEHKNKIIFEESFNNIPYKQYKNQYYINYEYFKSNILPLL